MTGKLFNTVIARDFIFTSKCIKKRWVAESLATMAVAASRPGKGKSSPQFASPLVSTTNPTLNNVIVQRIDSPMCNYNVQTSLL